MPDPQPRADSQGRTSNVQNGSPSKSSRSPSRPKKESRSTEREAVFDHPPEPTKTPTKREGSRGAGEKNGRADKSTGTTKTDGSRSTPVPNTTTRTTRSGTTNTSSEGEEDGTEESLPSKDIYTHHPSDSLDQQHAHDEADDGPLVDMETFGQLLEMDDDEEHSFSKSLTWDYFDQAVTTFKEMDAAVLGGDLITLSRKGHFLKGSSAALGLNRVKASCQKMQHYGNKKKANGEGTLTESEAMEQCKTLLSQLKEEQKLSKAWLERFYAERNV